MVREGLFCFLNRKVQLVRLIHVLRKSIHNGIKQNLDQNQQNQFRIKAVPKMDQGFFLALVRLLCGKIIGLYFRWLLT